MKKTLLTGIIMIAGACFAQAQTEQGGILAGGSVSMDFENNKLEAGSTTVDRGNTFSVSFNPNVGYFFMDGLAGGLELEISSSTFTEDQTDFETKFSTFNFGPFVKYYHSSGLFGLGRFGVGSAKEVDEDAGGTDETKFGVFTWRLGAGYALFLNDNVSLEPMLSYGSYNFTNKDSDPEVKTIDNSLRISVGFQIFL
ncbi:porin family protein [Fulvivirga sp. 29W222]|uniref:Porin family protein n=1 Tax=Fulvivirga marina TaxID=2494733 RepID=A0A937G288_9BACT|nr:outer membrane beta-barrel protein [Fulvivirga marina]MBL6448881.1 porin family protein [Fulvivirga marina]